MSSPLTLSEFLRQTGATLSFYDVGRRIYEIDSAKFHDFESTASPYPYPLRGQAWFALIQQRTPQPNEPTIEPVIWFLHFDLDEQGKLVQASRDDFMQRFVDIAAKPNESTDAHPALRENPYSFQPSTQKLANLHAMLAQRLGQPASHFYPHAKQYFAGELGWDQWKFVGLQGLADLAARLHDEGLASTLVQGIAQAPAEPLVALCQCLENHCPPEQIAQALYQRLALELETPEAPANLVAALLRGLSLSGSRDRAVAQVLQHPVSGDAEILATIGGRAWPALNVPDIANAFLTRLAGPGVNQAVFNNCLGDLLRLPGLREPLLQVLRSPSRPDSVAQAFQTMLAG